MTPTVINLRLVNESDTPASYPSLYFKKTVRRVLKARPGHG